jgi:serine/threonine protein kinase/regulator of sirC expression with transglutaminase-like and TPR domain
MTCCLNPHCPQQSPACADGVKYCSSCGTELITLSERYRPIKRIGQGGFGITYLAEDNARFNKFCVIKQLTLQVPDAKRLFEAEARRLEDLADYPSIPRLLAYHSNTDYLYLVQEFVEGQDLHKDLQQKGAFDEIYIEKFLAAILPILDVIHERGIIHRDIKLENIMHSSSDRLILIDFGISKIIPANNTIQPGTKAGTSGYAAPEQMKEGVATPASDLYSLGAACFHLLTNINPSSVFMDYGYAWTKNWRDHLPQPVGDNLGRIIDKLLKNEYKDRYQSAKEVLSDLNSPISQLQFSQQPIYSPAIQNNVATIISSENQKSSIPKSPLFLVLAILSGSIVTLIGIGGIFLLVFASLETPEKYLESGNKNAEKNKELAIQDYTKAIEINPEYPEAFLNRGITKSKLNNKKGAIEDYSQAIKLRPDYSDAYHSRGEVRAALNDKKGAIEDYTQSIKIRPDDQDSYNNRALIRVDLGDKKGALEDYDLAIKLKPDSSLIYGNRAIVRASLNDKKGAAEDYNQAIKLDPKNTDALFNRGNLRYDANDKKSAIDDYTQAIANKPDYADAHKNRAAVRFELGDKKGTIEDLKKASQLYEKQGNSKEYQKVMDDLKKVTQ